MQDILIRYLYYNSLFDIGRFRVSDGDSRFLLLLGVYAEDKAKLRRVYLLLMRYENLSVLEYDF